MKKIFLLILVVILTAGQAISQKYVSDKQLSDEERLAWWHEARFGMFIHWGVYAMYAGQYNGYEQARGGAEWIMNRCKIPVAEYREKAKEFNPMVEASQFSGRHKNP